MCAQPAVADGSSALCSAVPSGPDRPLWDSAALAGTVPARFNDMVARFASRPAVSCEGRIWTYEELDAEAGRVAATLAAHAEHLEVPLAILMAHDLPAIAAMLGALKAGRLFCVLQPSLPQPVISAFLNHAGTRLLLSDPAHEHQASTVAPAGSTVIRDRDLRAMTGCRSWLAKSHPSSSAICFTTGSTGRPRGTLRNHRGDLHDAMVCAEVLKLTPADRLTLLTPLGTGAGWGALFGGLLNGASVHLFDAQRHDLDLLIAWLERERITIYHSVPSLFRRWVDRLDSVARLEALRMIRLGGDALFRADFGRFHERLHPRCALVNGLGITEANGNVAFAFLDHRSTWTNERAPVGRPVKDMEVMLQDARGRPVPEGEMGEIVLRSRYLSSGYWRDPASTAAAFREEPGTGFRQFRTGDLGRILPDGQLVHLGRSDDQVKVRGNRVALGAVQGALLRVPDVMDGAVIVAPVAAGEQELHAFVVGGARRLDASAVRRDLSEKLPAFMIPVVTVLDEIPRLGGGKVDRARLEELAASAPVSVKEATVSPRNVVEWQVQKIWEKALDRTGMSVTQNFFAAGGTSLAAASIFAELSRVFHVHLPLSTLVQAPTIAALAALLVKEGHTDVWAPLVVLQSGRPPNPAFYCVPGAGSDALSLYPLAWHLGEDYAFCAFQSIGADGAIPEQRSVEQIAEFYVKALLDLQPDGPYHVGGISFGGLVAFEMARQLLAHGHQVGLVALLDAYGPGYPQKKPNPTLRRRLLHLLRWFLPIGAKEDLTWRNFRRGVVIRWKHLRAAWYLYWPYRRRPFDYLERFRFIQELCFAAHRKYRPAAPYPERLTLFRAATQPPAELFVEDPALGWGGLAGDGIDVIEIPARHETLLQEPGIRALAAALRQCMDQASATPAPTSSRTHREEHDR